MKATASSQNIVLKRFCWVVMILWTVLIAGLLLLKIYDTIEVTKQMAINDARTHYNREMSVRLWGASHGGVYVKVDKDTPPNPYLSHIPNRDIAINSQIKLTLMSPAYMLRQMMERYTKTFGVMGHITSLNPMRPENIADGWEKLALARFDNNETEILEFSDIHQKPYLRFMRPLIIKQDCFKCHTYKTRKLGDVGGGVSMSVPMAPYLEKQNKDIRFASISFGLLWILGISGGLFGFSRLIKNINERNLAREETQKAQQDLIEHQQSALDTQTKMTEAFARFVPKEFFEHLNKNSVVETELGDQILKEMTVLFSDIRSFTTISEGMNPQENFRFINSYLKEVGPIIRKYNGFIDKYIGDAIMALFPGDAEDGLKAAIDMQKKVTEYNDHLKKEGYEPIAIGIGVHSGNLMIGTIGEENRMETTVISDAVNLASRMEGLTKYYGTGICISEQFLKQLKNKDRYSYRYLDKVIVKGKNEPVSVLEILDGQLPASMEKKVITREEFQHAVNKYQKGEIVEALQLFNKVSETNKNDVTCQLYIERCKKLQTEGIPEGWNGIEKLDSK